MLGTNDIKFANRCRAFDASLGMMRLVEIVQKFSFLAGIPDTTGPDHVAAAAGADQGRMFNDLWGHAIAESKLFAKHYADVAKAKNVHFFDARRKWPPPIPTDGGHLDAANTRAIGTALVPVVKRLLAI